MRYDPTGVGHERTLIRVRDSHELARPLGDQAMEATALSAIPRALDTYPAANGLSLVQELAARASLEPLNAAATAIFILAIVHTFGAGWFTSKAHDLQHAHDATSDAAGVIRHPSPLAELMHFLGEVEVVFGLWAIMLLATVIVGLRGVGVSPPPLSR